MGNLSALARADFGAQTRSREESRRPILSDKRLKKKIKADGLGGRSMKTWLLFAALVSAPVAAQAESFTFTSTSKMLSSKSETSNPVSSLASRNATLATSV